MFGKKKKPMEEKETDKPEAAPQEAEAEVKEEASPEVAPVEKPAPEAKPEVQKEPLVTTADWTFTFQVKLPDVPMKEVEAADAHDAFEVYKKHFGITSTDHKPVIIAL